MTNGDGPPRRKDPKGPYGDGSVWDEGSHIDNDLLNVGGLDLYVVSYGLILVCCLDDDEVDDFFATILAWLDTFPLLLFDALFCWLASLGLLKLDNAGFSSTFNPPMPDAFDFGIAKRRLVVVMEEEDDEGAVLMLKDATDAANNAANNTTATMANIVRDVEMIVVCGFSADRRLRNVCSVGLF